MKKYESLKVTELKKLCQENHISDLGTKPALVARLNKFDASTDMKLPLEEDFVSGRTNNKKVSQDVLFLQMKSSNLHYYLNSGVIYPLSLEENSIYKYENRKIDQFTNLPEYIILAAGPFIGFMDEDVLIELISNELSTEEIVKGQIYYVSDPIVISRINKIYFKSQRALQLFISSAKTFPDFLLNENLCQVLSLAKESKAVNLPNLTLPPNISLDKWKSVMGRFDKIMGMFSFMKNSGSFLTFDDNLYQEYPFTYINLINLINSEVKPINQKDMGLYRYILFPQEIEPTNIQRVIFRQILDLIYADTIFDFDIARGIIEKSLSINIASIEERGDLMTILNYLDKLEHHQISFKELFIKDAIRKNFPVVALLFLTRYSNKSKSHTDKQAVRVLLINNELDFSKNLIEFLLSVLGLYYGYKMMVKEDTNIKINDPFLASVIQKKQSIKFRADSVLERVVIESIFSFSILGKNYKKPFPYFKPNVVKQPAIIFPRYGKYEYVDKSITILETTISFIAREDKIDKILNLIDSSYPEKISSKYILANFLTHNYSLSKSIIKEIIKFNDDSIDSSEIINLINFDKSRKNL